MGKSLLIHANNTPLSVQQLFPNENTINFNYSNHKYSNIDEYISKVIREQLKGKDFDLIYIKDTLSSNYLELYGLIVAYHIRLSVELKDKRYVPIVILSDIDGFSLNNMTSLARILFTQNIYLELNKKESIKKYNQRPRQPLGAKEYANNFLNIISVDAPENSSNHSIANEWAIYRWAEFLKIKYKDSNAIDKNREKIASMLYFKYLLAKNPVTIKKKNGIQFVPRPPKNSGKILYIDDEWAKGWSDIFTIYFNENITFNNYGYDFKNKIEKDICYPMVKYIIKEKPDVVLLDLRLTEEDHDENREIQELTGIKIVEAIKNINPGIQVIMFTATSKSTILEKLYEHGILGYIKKEHPTDINISTKENFDKLADLVDKGLEKKYLKEIWSIQKNILKLDLFKQEDESFKKIKLEMSTIFEILDSNIENKIKFTLITIFKILEILTEKYKLTGGEFTKIKNLFHNNGLTKHDDDISKIVCSRNFLVHSGVVKKLNKDCLPTLIRKPNEENILTWFRMLKTILEKINGKSK